MTEKDVGEVCQADGKGGSEQGLHSSVFIEGGGGILSVEGKFLSLIPVACQRNVQVWLLEPTRSGLLMYDPQFWI